MKLLQVKDLVIDILTRYPETRDSDNKLYIKVIDTIQPDVSKKSVEEVLLHLKELGLPQFESVRRSRAKAQEENEHLRGSKEVTQAREDKEKEYFDFYRRTICF